MNILWQTLIEPGLEHLVLDVQEQGIVAEGSSIGLADDQPFRLQYLIQTDAAFQFKSVQAAVREPFTRQMELRRDAKGQWFNKLGLEVPHLHGCHEIDLETTPFTNTLPIRRLQWKVGQTERLQVAYIRVPSFAVARQEQHYTCLSISPDGGVFRYEDPASGFSAELHVDAYGLVVSYGEIFKRVYPL